MIKGFRDFLLRGNVIDLAVAVVVGGAFNTIVSSLAKDFITPLIGAIGGTPEFSKIVFTINGSRFMAGDFLDSLISFLIVSATVYFVIVVPMNALKKKTKGETPTVKTCPECFSTIPYAAKRCKYCTAVLVKK